MSDALEAIVEDNARARAELIEALDALPEQHRLEGWFGPAEWSVQDVLAHMASWQRGWSAALGQIAQGERPSIPGYTPNADDPDAADAAYNAASVSQARDLGWEQLLAALGEAREQHDAAVRGLEVLDADRYAEGRGAYRLAAAAGHDREHCAAILVWRRERGV
jgi:uncharacterized damage-inducible protein DinB